MADNRSYRTRGVRTERYKYFKYFEHDPVKEELYDLKADPSEMRNLTRLRSRNEKATKNTRNTQKL